MQSDSFLQIHTAIYEWSKECPEDLKRDLRNYFDSQGFLDRPNVFYKGMDGSSGKWLGLITVQGAESTRLIISQKLGYQFMELHEARGTITQVTPAPQLPNKAAYDKFQKDITKANKIYRTKAKVNGWTRTLDRASEMVAAAPKISQSTDLTAATTDKESSLTDSQSQTTLPKLPSSTLLTSLKGPERSAASFGMWFISVDIESYERDHAKILEIGWSIWDSRVDKYVDRHYAISDYRHLKNGKFVADRRDRFIFGTTVWASLQSSIEAFQKDIDTAANRNAEGLFALIAHDMSSDESYLKDMGVSFPAGMIKFDTLELNCARAGDSNKIGLGKLLDDLDIENYCLHNAGNDAHYTLQLFLFLTRNHLEKRSQGLVTQSQ
ncbi:hypothetical protein BGZ76_007742 [Entomortierella beljakovae]|nr:hypothetical protein BGZ76_007742 [Entomortierella beljakovae]